jgi:hypothetical protein
MRQMAARSNAGLGLLLAGLTIYLVGLLGADIFLTRLSSIAVLSGIVWFLAGARRAADGRAARVPC